ncbi:MAG: sensor domain-containing diguanylate cyclase [Rhizobiales bacterium]|nr:sensor domain-containing diguanylate cyclase [Hyphomicrobiales bacterium]
MLSTSPVGSEVASSSPASEDFETRTYARSTALLLAAVQNLSFAGSLEEIQAIVRSTARELTGCDGATFVLNDRDGAHCYYADEDAIAPLWKGRRFPQEICISGWAMRHKAPVVIPDIYADDRIPAEAYRPTFVKSLVMVPIRTRDPVGAIGNYWATRHEASAQEVQLLQALADATSLAMETVRVRQTASGHLRDLSALSAAKAALERRSVTDELTGLYNRRGFFERAAKLDGADGIQVLFVDLDGLKAVNDRDGHAAGDDLLRRAGQCLTAAAAPGDLVARLGGDEFCMLVVRPKESAEALSARVQAAVDAHNGRTAEGAPLSFSIGVAQGAAEGSSGIAELVARADHLMYGHKRMRRRQRA